MKHTERVRAIAIELGVPVSAVHEVWGALTAALTKSASKNHDMLIPLFFNSSVGKRPARRYWDDRAGRYKVARSRKRIKVTFTPTIKLRLKNRGF